jgi:hypothetical protein
MDSNEAQEWNRNKFRFSAVSMGRTVTGGKKKKTPWPLVRERTIPTDRPPLVDEI